MRKQHERIVAGESTGQMARSMRIAASSFTGSEDARVRNELEANGYGPPRRPQRGYHGKRDLKPLEE